MSHVHLTKFLIKKDENLELKIGGDFDQNGGEAGIDPNRRRKPPIGGGMGTLQHTQNTHCINLRICTSVVIGAAVILSSFKIGIGAKIVFKVTAMQISGVESCLKSFKG